MKKRYHWLGSSGSCTGNNGLGDATIRPTWPAGPLARCGRSACQPFLPCPYPTSVKAQTSLRQFTSLHSSALSFQMPSTKSHMSDLEWNGMEWGGPSDFETKASLLFTSTGTAPNPPLVTISQVALVAVQQGRSLNSSQVRGWSAQRVPSPLKLVAASGQSSRVVWPQSCKASDTRDRARE